jgi:hypothetical protein
MTAPQFNQVINGAIQEAFTEGVAKKRMSVIEVVQVLSFHSANVLVMLVKAQREAQTNNLTNEIVLPFDRKLNPPQEDKK